MFAPTLILLLVIGTVILWSTDRKVAATVTGIIMLVLGVWYGAGRVTGVESGPGSGPDETNIDHTTTATTSP